MSRVSENSSYHAINHSVGQTKKRLENLQIQGSNLKRMQKPSDDPIGNTELLSIRSKQIDGEQYLRNSSFAQTQLTFTEAAVEELTDLLVKTKELAIGQASNFYDADIRSGVAKEVSQLRDQSLSIANRRLGNRYIFSGFKTLTRPFDENGKYYGDNKTTSIEIIKDYFIPINFSGTEIFFQKNDTPFKISDPLKNTPLDMHPSRDLASVEEASFNETQDDPYVITGPTTSLDETLENNSPIEKSIFDTLKSFHDALISNNHEVIQAILPELDSHIDRMIEMRTKIGSISNSISNSTNNIEKSKVFNAEYQSRLEDADVAELMTDLTKQQNVLSATYKASAQLMDKKLLDFLR